MSFDAKAIFANLAEKERIKGHHSPEGRAIRVLSRALSGWSNDNLSRHDVVGLCDQAVEDWLKARLKRSPWSMPPMPALLNDAVKKDLITRLDAVRLQRIRNVSVRSRSEPDIHDREVEAALEFCIDLIEKHW